MLVAGGNEQKIGTQGDRLKTAIFPDASSEQTRVPNKPEGQTNVQRLTESSQLIKQSLTNLLQYKVHISNCRLLIRKLSVVFRTLSVRLNT